LWVFKVIDNCLKLRDPNNTIFWLTLLTRLTLLLCLSVNEQWWMAQMAVRCCKSPSRASIVNRGCREFILLFKGSLIPSFSLIINAPNASRNDVAGAPRSAKFWAYSASNSDHRMSLAPIAQRLSSASFPPQENSKSKGGPEAGSTFRYLVAGDTRVLTHYIAVFFGTSPPFFSQKTQRHVFFFTWFSKPYLKLHSPRSNNQNIQRNKASSTSDTARVCL
jgi:hypothetical protein